MESSRLRSDFVAMGIVLVLIIASCGNKSTVRGNPTASQPLPPPSPILPVLGAVIRQNNAIGFCPASPERGSGFRVEFKWTSVPLAEKYELVLERRSSQLPAVHVVVKDSAYTYIACGAFVIDHNLLDWRWKVRALDASGTPGAWSVEQSLSFAPCRVSSGKACAATSNIQ